MPFRIVLVCAESNMAAAARTASSTDAGIELHTYLAHEVLVREEQLRAHLAQADVAIASMVNTDEEALRLSDLFEAARPPTVLAFNCQPELLRYVRCANLDGEALLERSALRELAAAFREIGAPLPQMGHVMLAAVPRLLHLLPSDGPLAAFRPFAQAAQYWQHATPANLSKLFAYLCALAADFDAKGQAVDVVPGLGLWHPEANGYFTDWERYQAWYARYLPDAEQRPYVGVVLFRQLVATGDTLPYSAVVAALEAKGLAVVAGFGGLDNTPLVEKLMGPANIQLLLNLTGFNLVGSMGRPAPDRAVELLSRLDVPYLVCGPLLFQTLSEWQQDRIGLAPTQTALQIVLPELEGGIEPRVIGGRESGDRLEPAPGQVERLAERVRRWIALRQKPVSDRRVAITLFSFPPDKGAVGTAAYLDVFASLHALLSDLQATGYDVAGLPPSAEALLNEVVGSDVDTPVRTDGRVHDTVETPEYRRLVPYHKRVQRNFGPPPGRLDTDGRSIRVRGRRFGNVFVGIQPSFGYEGDPMRLLFETEASPSHSFAAYYAWIGQVFKADVSVHFGTHGALEFMPGKQVGLAPECFPDLLTGNTPHVYYYSINNPSEASIAKRRSGAVLVSYLSPPLTAAGLYKELAELRQALEAHAAAGNERARRRAFEHVVTSARRCRFDVELAECQISPDTKAEELSRAGQEACARRLRLALTEIEERLIPIGLHVTGRPLPSEARAAFFQAEARAGRPEAKLPPLPELLHTLTGRDAKDCQRLSDRLAETAAANELPDVAATWQQVLGTAPSAVQVEALAGWWRHFEAYRRRLEPSGELPALRRAIEGRYIPPSPGGDPIRESAVLPSGRNIHALDPYRIPSAGAVSAARHTVETLVARLRQEQGDWPESIAMVLWGTDNIKTQGEGVAQVLRLLGVEAVSDSLGRMTRLRLIPLDELGRPRIDVVMTLSGIFRDLFPTVAELLDRAVRLAAEADEPPEWNFVRRKTLRLADELGLDQAAAAVRIFSNQAGMYGTGVNHAVEGSDWDQKSDLARLFTARKSYSYGQHGQSEANQELMEAALAGVAATVQNLDSAEIGPTDVDHYFEYLGGLTAAVEAANGKPAATYVIDPLQGDGSARPLDEVLRLDVRSRLLNPKWHDALLEHGYQGVSEIAARLDHVFGWSATTAAVDAWVYEAASDTYLLDDAMRARLSRLNPKATQRMLERVLEADQRGFWQPGAARRAALEAAYDEMLTHWEGLA